jgi:hypothetical protein
MLIYISTEKHLPSIVVMIYSIGMYTSTSITIFSIRLRKHNLIAFSSHISFLEHKHLKRYRSKY